VRAAAGAIGRRTVPRLADVVRQAAAAVDLRSRRLSLRARRRLLALLLLTAALGALYMFWFRDSSLVRVEKVTVTGLTGTDAGRERAAVIAAAKRMTTLHVDEDALLRAVGPGAAVRGLRVSSDFPHGLRIQVIETAPVAILVDGANRVAVGAGGVLLPHVRVASADVPAIDVGALPSGLHLGRGRALRLVSCAAAAPAALRSRIARVRELPGKGLVAFLSHGPQVILGSARDLPAKWAAAAAVLADPSSRGASYVDVRVAGRPVAGGLAVPPPSAADQAGAPPPGQPETAAQGTPGATSATGATATGTTGTSAPGTTAAPGTATPPSGATTPSATAPSGGTGTPASGAGGATGTGP
jgi:cell division septal protein FtsQ